MNIKFLSVFAALSILGFAAAEEKLAVEENVALEEQQALEEHLALEQEAIDFKPTQCLRPAERCVRELEGIVYQPETAAKLYLDKISEQIKLSSPILWTNQAEGFIKTFEQKYKVKVTIMSPFRNVEYPNVVVKAAFELPPGSYYSTTSTANMNGNGYAYDADGDQRIMYEFIVFNSFGELKYVLITMPIADAPPQFCK